MIMKNRDSISLMYWTLIICLTIIQTNKTYSQETDENSPFRFVFDLRDTISDPKYIAVNFIDTTNMKILSNFNLVENNPYNELDYPEIENWDPWNKNRVYLFNNIRLNDIILADGNLLKRNKYDTMTLVNANGISHYQAFTERSWLIVKYTFSIGSLDWAVGRSDAVLIFDTQGNLLHKLNDFDTDVREWALTENGRYFSFAYKGFQDELDDSFQDVGYKIIDLQKNEIAYQENFGHSFYEVRTSAFKDVIVVTGFSVDFLYIFIDFSKHRKYSRVFSGKELGLWKKTSDTGIIMFIGNRNSDLTQFLSFEKDFKAKDF